VVRARATVGVGRLVPPRPGRADDDLDGKIENDQIGDHLPGDHQPGRMGLGGDVAEADGGEDRDAEVQVVGVGKSRASKFPGASAARMT